MYINIPKSKFLRKFLTEHLFNYLFDKNENVKNGEILCINDDLFEFDDYNGNINSLKNFYKLNGFWNFIKIKNNLVYNITNNKWANINSQGYSTGVYYKNGFEKATKEQIEL